MMSCFYHLYNCDDADCYLSPNPNVYSHHWRGVHLSASSPVRVRCPGCGKDMKISRDADNKPVIYVVENQDAFDDKIVAEENKKP